jgi:hypothetical protein
MIRTQLASPDGQDGVSGVMTVVDRSLDEWSAPYLARRAIVGGGAFRHRFGDRQYEVWGSSTMSRLDGAPAAITAVQENPVHDLQRADDPRLDTTRTSLVGDQEELAVGKYGGSFTFEGAYERQSRGYETNDLGYLQRADEQTFQVWAGYVDRHPRGIYQLWRANLNAFGTWNAAGTRLETAVNTNAHMTLANNWSLNAGVTVGQLGGTECDHCARGGPAIRSDPQTTPFVDIIGDSRARLTPELYVPLSFGDGGRSYSAYLEPSLGVRVLPPLQLSVGLVLGRNRNGTQWLGNFADSNGTRYSFARIDQTTRTLTFRGSYAATPFLSLETYVAPFASDGAYSNIRALSATPLAADYDERFVGFTPPAGTAERFAVRQSVATSVLRWEYHPGSTLYMVWSNQTGVGNTLTMKLSYWLAR